jgi:HAD superfamily hydrolase (TIGR01509 family)
MSIRLVIFDCDGVMFVSERANIAFYNEVLRRAGEPALTETAEIACHALSSAQLFEKYYGHETELLAKIREIAGSIDYDPFFPLMEPRPELRSVLAKLGESYSVAMATNRSKTVQGVLDRFDLGRYFHYAIGVLDVGRPKPHPDMLLKCAEHFSVAPHEAVYVGDQHTDAQAAEAARMPFVGIGPAGAQSRHSIDSLEELPALVEAIGGNTRPRFESG